MATFEFRVSVSKLLIEVEEYQNALYLLNSLYDEDSLFLDVCYMLAFVNFKLNNYKDVSQLLKQLETQDFKEDSELQTAYEELVDEFNKLPWKDEGEEIQDADAEENSEEWMEIE